MQNICALCPSRTLCVSVHIFAVCIIVQSKTASIHHKIREHKTIKENRTKHDHFSHPQFTLVHFSLDPTLFYIKTKQKNQHDVTSYFTDYSHTLTRFNTIRRL